MYAQVPALKSAMQTILEIAEEFAKALAEPQFRDEAMQVLAPSDKENWPPRFRKMRRRADDLQKVLEEIFFDSALLGQRSKRYLVF